MGEYVKHPSVDGEEIKIGVCRGSDWETWFTKEMLVELRETGFIDFYAGEFDDSNTLNEFIEHYDEMITSYILYSSVDDILNEYPEYEELFNN